MALTLQDVMEELETERNASKPSGLSGVDSLVKTMGDITKALGALDTTLKSSTGKSPVKPVSKGSESLQGEQIKAVKISVDLENKVASSKINAAKRVADKQIALATMELKTAKDKIAKDKAAAKFAVTDKYSTIKNAVTSVESRTEDPLAKFIIKGLGRFISEKKAAPAMASVEREASAKYKAAQAVYATKTDKAVASFEKKQDKIARTQGLPATKVPDAAPTSRSKAPVKSVKGAPVSPTMIPDTTVPEAAPVYRSKAPVKSVKGAPVSPTMIPTPGIFADTPAPKKLNKALPVAKPSRATGAFGSKAGMLNVGGIGTGLGAMAGSVGSMAGSFTKFLGPWGLVASSLMSFDKMVPVISDGMGALVDLSKLAMPLVISSILEVGSTIASSLNGLLSVFGVNRKFTQSKETQDAMATKTAEVLTKKNKDRLAKEAREAAIVGQGNPAVTKGYADTTTPLNTATFKPIKREVPLTSPAEATKSTQGSTTTSSVSSESPLLSYAQAQQAQTQAILGTILEVAKNPGTTPVVTSNPSLMPWPV
jgi:hypothetical protein